MTDALVAPPEALSEPVGDPDATYGPRWAQAVESLFVLVAPVAVFYVLRVRAMAPFDMIDEGFQTAYAQHGRDLVARYGVPASVYFWVRVGFSFPAHLTYLAFGPVGGFYVFRYVLALVASGPTYLLFRRLWGPGAAAVAVLVILTCPVVLQAWGTDYGDSAAVSYLIGGMACLVMPGRSRRRRHAWLLASGVLLALAPLAHFASVPLVLAAVGAYVLVRIRRPFPETSSDVGLLVAGAAATWLAMAGMAHWYLGHGDLITPTLRAARRLRTPAEIVKWHSSNWRWVLYVPYVIVPPALLAAWLVARARHWRRLKQEELILGATFALQVVAYFALQFAGGREQTLEFHLFSSMLWSGAVLTLALLVCAVTAPLLARRRLTFLPAALVVVVPLVYRFWRPQLTLRFSVGLVLAAIASVLALPAFLGLSNRAVAGMAAAGILTIILALTVAVGPPHAPLRGTTLLPQGSYREMLGGNGATDVDTYRVAGELIDVVPPARHRGDDLLLWWPSGQFVTVNEPAAQYLWHLNSLQEDMPSLNVYDRQLLDARRPATLVMLSETGREFPAALSSLAATGYDPQVVRQRNLRSGPVHLSVAVVDLGRFAQP
jgi:hypothetical protein